MGLFSGSFGTGLMTGLATSVDKSLRNAMDKRDEELSSARKFWQQRQAQKMDAAMDQERIAVAGKIFNDIEDEELEAEAEADAEETDKVETAPEGEESEEVEASAETEETPTEKDEVEGHPV